MIKNNEPFLIEYNVRMGDPECQTILPLLKSDFLDIINACCEQKLNQSNVDWSDKKSLSIVLCSKGYPESYEKNVEIKNLNKIKNNKNNFIFHAGTISKNDKIFANGGRVLNFVSISESYLEARKSAIDKIKDLNWGGGFFRKDIGFKAIDQMRVIGGYLKGQKILAPTDKSTRPLKDRVRESIFNIIEHSNNET